MEVLSFSDLVSKKHLKPFKAEIEGLGVVGITQLSAINAYSCINAGNDLEGEELEIFIATKVCLMLKGAEPTEEEVHSLRGNMSTSAIGQIYVKGLNSNGADYESSEEAEKN